MGIFSYTQLDDRGVLSVSGEDAREFLQGLISNDMDRVNPKRATWAAFLTAQGKYLHDFFIFQKPTNAGDSTETFLIDCEAARRDDLMKRLRIYKLRSRADIEDRTDDLGVAAVFGDPTVVTEAFVLQQTEGAASTVTGGLACVDPRLAAAGVRVIIARDGLDKVLKAHGAKNAEPETYDRLRLRLGLPDGSRDMIIEKSVLLEGGFEELNGVDFDKGCYLGQELTARTKHRGLVKRRLLPVVFDGPSPLPGAAIFMEGREAGEMRSSRDGHGLAILRIDAVERGDGKTIELTAGETKITPHRPIWATPASNSKQQEKQSE